LDAFDVMLYALVLTAVITELGVSTQTGGLMGSLTLGASAIRGPRSIAARRSASCRAAGPSATAWPPSVAIVLPRYGWRAVFFVGIAPALFTLWIRRNVKEPDMWLALTRQAARPGVNSRDSVEWFRRR
jgi:hypothetical protein